MNDKINFGHISKFVLMGGGQCLFDAVAHLVAKNQQVSVITSSRHHNSPVNYNEQMLPLNAAVNLIGIECKLVNTVDDDCNLFNSIDKDAIAITPSAEWIFRQNIIDKFHGRIVNIHGTRLPEMKGGGGMSWNLMMGIREGGSTIHFVDEGIDTGDILMQDSYEFPLDARSLDEATAFAQKRNSNLMICFLDKLLANETFARQKQDSSSGSYWPRLKTDVHGLINWSWSAHEISSFVAAFGQPYKGASTFLGENRIRVLKTNVVSESCRFHPFQYGIVFRISHSGLHVACKHGELVIEKVCNESGEPVAFGNLLGRRFHTPSVYLEAAMRTRVVFKPASEFDEYRTNL